MDMTAPSTTAPKRNFRTAVANRMMTLLINLHHLWLNKNEREDFAVYEKTMKEKFSTLKAGTFIKATKRPFGFVYEFGGHHLQVKVTARELTIKLIKPANSVKPTKK